MVKGRWQGHRWHWVCQGWVHPEMETEWWDCQVQQMLCDSFLTANNMGKEYGNPIVVMWLHLLCSKGPHMKYIYWKKRYYVFLVPESFSRKKSHTMFIQYRGIFSRMKFCHSRSQCEFPKGKLISVGPSFHSVRCFIYPTIHKYLNYFKMW